MPDRTYWRAQSNVRLIDEARYSGHELCIALGERLEDLQADGDERISEAVERAEDAADALGITAHRLKALGVVDKIVNEPVGGAHRDPKQMAAFLKRALTDAFRQVSDLKVDDLLARRYERLQSYGRFTDTKNTGK